MTTSCDAVVLAGGAARRLGGTDKPALPVGGLPLLDRVLAACAGADRTVVVGPRGPTARPVRWAREEPPGGGPLPALAAGLAALAADVRPRRPGAVLVLAADLPFLTADTAGVLIGALTAAGREETAGAQGEPSEAAEAGAESADRSAAVRRAAGAEPADRGEAAGSAPWDGVVLTDSGGRDQPLAAAYRIEPLRRELALLAAEHGGLAGLPLRLLTGELTLRRIADPTGEASFDCDTWEDVAAARARLGTAPEG